MMKSRVLSTSSLPVRLNMNLKAQTGVKHAVREIKRRSNKEKKNSAELTCTEEPYIYLNQHKDESVILEAATFFCNVYSHLELLVCIQIGDGKELLILYKTRTCMASDSF